MGWRGACAASDRLGMSRQRRGGSVLRIGPGARPVLRAAVGNESRVPTLGLPEFSHLCGAAAAAVCVLELELRDSRSPLLNHGAAPCPVSLAACKQSGRAIGTKECREHIKHYALLGCGENRSLSRCDFCSMC